MTLFSREHSSFAHFFPENGKILIKINDSHSNIVSSVTWGEMHWEFPLAALTGATTTTDAT